MIRVRVSSRPLGRALCWDLENKPGAYWYDGNTTSIITAFGWKWDDEPCVRTLLLRRDGKFVYQPSEVEAAKIYSADRAYGFFVSELASAGLVYGHNIRRHDLPILDAGLFRRQMPPLPELLTTDTCRDLPKTAGVSKSLANMAAMYGLPGEKLTMTQPAWEEANALTPDGITLARERVVSDVILQERLRNKLLELEILKPARTWAP